MIQLIEMIISSTMLLLINIYIIKKIDNPKLTNITLPIYIIGFVFCILSACNYLFVPGAIKLVLITLMLIVMFKTLFPDEKINIIVICSIICQMLMLMAEFFFAFIVSIVFNMDQSTFVNNTFGTLLSNIIIGILILLLINFKPIQNFCINTVRKFENISDKKIIILLVILMIIINLLLFTVYYQLDLIYLICINWAFIIFITYITFKFMDEKNKLLIQTNRTLQYKAENDALINNLHEYEKLADQHRMLNHENKNQLLAIKQMINNNEDGVISYIDKLLKTKVPDDQSLLANTKRIPSGGLQGIIYQKMLIIKKAKIKHSLNISRELKNLDFKKLDIDTNVDVCKIVGVFLDNAIEEVKGLRERMIGVDLYVEDDKLCISVSNTFGKNKDFSKIDEVGYTTKSDGHGYGLSLVREILSKNERLENTRAVTGKFFTQVIKISDMKHDDE